MITVKGVNAVDDDRNFQDNIEAMTGKRRAQDYDDLQNELAGRETGRSGRFLGNENAGAKARRKKARDNIEMTALQILLDSDPEYAAQYTEIMDLLSRAETATDDALETAHQDLQDGQEVLDNTRDSANKLPDGTSVYRDANGNVWTEDGRRIEGDELDGIVWKDGASSYEDILKQKQTVEDIRRRIEELRRYQVDVLGKARGRMTDPDNPPSKDDLDKIQKDILKHPDPVAQRKLEPQDAPEINQGSSAIPPVKPSL